MTWDLNSPWSLFLACLVSGLLVPVPEDVALLLAGWAVRDGRLPWGPTLIASFVGVLGRDGIAFSAGYYLEHWIEKSVLGRRLLASRKLSRAREMLHRHGVGMLVAARFAIGMRSLLYFAAGLVGHSYRTFLLADTVGLLITTPLCLGLGWYFGEAAAATLQDGLPHQRLILTVVIGFLLVRWGLRWRSRRRALARAMGERQ